MGIPGHFLAIEVGGCLSSTVLTAMVAAGPLLAAVQEDRRTIARRDLDAWRG